MKYIVLLPLILLGVATAAPDLKKELPVIRMAAERNHCTGDLFTILLAIRMAENGRSGFEFGVIAVKGTDLETQAAWAAATVVKNYQRWLGAGKPNDYIDFLGDRYCPVGVNDNGTNKYWKKNVRFWIGKLGGVK